MGKSRADTVYQQTELRLSRLVSGDEGTVRGRLANLRRGAGRIPGDDPRAWGILFSELPEKMLGQYGEPSREEWAIHTALTMFALHQQKGFETAIHASAGCFSGQSGRSPGSS